MAYDEGLAEVIRADLEECGDLAERKMFGGLAFMLDGNMVAGIYSGGGIFRVGKQRIETALAVDGTQRMEMGGRAMGGMVVLTDEGMADDERRGALLRMALDCVAGLPPK